MPHDFIVYYKLGFLTQLLAYLTLFNTHGTLMNWVFLPLSFQIMEGPFSGTPSHELDTLCLKRYCFVEEYDLRMRASM